MKTSLWAPIALALALATGCDTADGYDTQDVSERASCATPGGAGIVGLTDVTIAGTPDIVGPHADVFANDLVSLAGNYYIDGDVVSPTNVTVSGNSGTLTGTAQITGSFVSVNPPYADATDASYVNNNAAIASHITNDELKLSGRTEAVIPGGVYYLDEGIRLSGQSKLRIEGDVIFYVNGEVSLSGQSQINTDGGSYRVELISISSDDIKISGTSDVVMNVFAPLAPVNLSGTSDYEGTVLGESVTLTGTNGFTTAGDALSYLGTCSGGLPNLPGQPD